CAKAGGLGISVVDINMFYGLDSW
nr:immunoglobulin heavy chain junction region [Macaca mulatta]MOV46213.1 immunoglobulin heavy chain junction region [Macaca mulatta]